MLNGATVMDAALIVIAGDQKCPQKQTKEHVVALDMMGISDFLVIQNKIDLISPETAMNNHDQIKDFLKTSCPRALDSPIIPTCANKGLNFEHIYSFISELNPPRDEKASPLMMVVRSFDINRPGEAVEKLQGNFFLSFLYEYVYFGSLLSYD
jgi:translation initiation factor 2 subunit 3